MLRRETLYVFVVVFFFFFKQKTAYEMRISDWSSDVCSSDLGEDRVLVKLSDVPPLLPKGLVAVEDHGFYSHSGISIKAIFRAGVANLRAGHVVQIGRASCRERVCQYV